MISELTRTAILPIILAGNVYIGIEIAKKLYKKTRKPNTNNKTVPVRRYKQILPLDFGNNDKNGKRIVGDLVECPHVLIGGATKSGKGVTIVNLLLSILLYSIDKVEVNIIDIKELDYNEFGRLSNVKLVATLKDSIKLLEGVKEEHKKRVQILKKAGYKNIQAYNKNMPKKDRLSYIVNVIDEVAELVLTFTGDSEKAKKHKLVNLLVSITQIGRATGLHCILATQNPTVEVINSLIKSNCTTRIGLRVATPANSVALGVKDAHKIKATYGYGVLQDPHTENDNILINIPYKSDSEVSQLLKSIK